MPCMIGASWSLHENQPIFGGPTLEVCGCQIAQDLGLKVPPFFVEKLARFEFWKSGGGGMWWFHFFSCSSLGEDVHFNWYFPIGLKKAARNDFMIFVEQSLGPQAWICQSNPGHLSPREMMSIRWTFWVAQPIAASPYAAGDQVNSVNSVCFW